MTLRPFRFVALQSQSRTANVTAPSAQKRAWAPAEPRHFDIALVPEHRLATGPVSRTNRRRWRVLIRIQNCPPLERRLTVRNPRRGRVTLQVVSEPLQD